MTSLAGDTLYLLLSVQYREFSTSQIAFQVTQHGKNKSSFHEVLLLHPKIFLFLADIHQNMYNSIPPLDFVIVWDVATN